jgi:cellulose biosynthesis protein BcsQ
LSIPVVAFFNDTGGVGKTTLVYHLAWMYADLGARVLAADLDPQANLTSAFMDEDQLQELWPEGSHTRTVYGCVEPLLRGVGDIAQAHVDWVGDRLGLIAGDLALSGFEDELSSQWPGCMDRKERAFRVTSSFWRLLQAAASSCGADLILVDLGPNLGAINRASLIAADFVVVPLSPDLFSLQGLKNLGPAFRRWREEWADRLERNPNPDLELPRGSFKLAGYVILQHAVRLDRPVQAYTKWITRIPDDYTRHVLDDERESQLAVASDPNNLALLKHYRSLMPLAQEARKPIFHLTAADGAIGSHSAAAKAAFTDFRTLALRIAERVGVSVLPPLFREA